MDLSNKALALSVASSSRVLQSVSPFVASESRESSAPSVNVKVVKLEECPEECDERIREAKFAFRSTDLGSWNSLSSAGEENTNSDPTAIQHWALVVHFPISKKTHLLEAWKDENGLLQAGRAEGVDYEVFEKAIYFGTTETCPSELLEKAKQVPTGAYNILFNNCQTWLKDFLGQVSSVLLTQLTSTVAGI